MIKKLILITVIFLAMVTFHEIAHKVVFETVGCTTEFALDMDIQTIGTCRYEQLERAEPMNMMIDVLGYTIVPMLFMILSVMIIKTDS